MTKSKFIFLGVVIAAFYFPGVWVKVMADNVLLGVEK